jgi:hypothetical protein
LVKKLERSRLKKLAVLMMALSTLPGRPQDRALAAMIADHCCEETGMLLTDKMPPEKLIALRSHLLDFSEDLCLKSIIKEIDTFPMIVDSGASAVCTPEPKDIIPGTYKKIEGKSLQGIAQSLSIVGQGLARYEVIDNQGKPVVIETLVYHIPDLPVRLLSPQVILRSVAEGKLYEFAMRAEASVLRFWTQQEVTVPYNASSKLPLLYASMDLKKSADALESSLMSQLEEEKNQNLTSVQKTWFLPHPLVGQARTAR